MPSNIVPLSSLNARNLDANHYVTNVEVQVAGLNLTMSNPHATTTEPPNLLRRPGGTAATAACLGIAAITSGISAFYFKIDDPPTPGSIVAGSLYATFAAISSFCTLTCLAIRQKQKHNQEINNQELEVEMNQNTTRGQLNNGDVPQEVAANNNQNDLEQGNENNN